MCCFVGVLWDASEFYDFLMWIVAISGCISWSFLFLVFENDWRCILPGVAGRKAHNVGKTRVKQYLWAHIYIYTLPETKRKLVFQPSILRGYTMLVSGMVSFLLGFVKCVFSFILCHGKSSSIKPPFWRIWFAFAKHLKLIPSILGCPWKLVTSYCSKLVYNLLKGQKQPTYIGVK